MCFNIFFQELPLILHCSFIDFLVNRVDYIVNISKANINIVDKYISSSDCKINNVDDDINQIMQIMFTSRDNNSID